MFLTKKIRPSNPFREYGKGCCVPAEGVSDVEDPDTCYSKTVIKDRGGIVVEGSEKGNGLLIGFDNIRRSQQRTERGIGHLHFGILGIFPHTLFDPEKEASSLSGVDAGVLGESFEGSVKTSLEVRAFSTVVEETTKPIPIPIMT